MANVTPEKAIAIHKLRVNGARYFSKVMLSIFLAGMYIPQVPSLIEGKKLTRIALFMVSKNFKELIFELLALV